MQINAFLLDSPVSDTSRSPESHPPVGDSAASRHPTVRVLVGLLVLEAAGVAAAAVYLVVELLIAPADSAISGIALAVVAVIAAIWIAVIAVNVLRGNAWVRGASIVVQVLIGAVAIGSFQGEAALPAVGVALLVPAVLVLVLLFTPPVVQATGHRES